MAESKEARVLRALKVLAALESGDPKVIAETVSGEVAKHNPEYAPLQADLAAVMERALAGGGGLVSRLFGWLWRR